MFLGLLNFSWSLAFKCASLDNKPCMIRPSLNDLNLIEFIHYIFVISVDKCSGSWNTVDELSTKIYVPSKTKDNNVKLFNMKTRIDKTYIMWLQMKIQ